MISPPQYYTLVVVSVFSASLSSIFSYAIIVAAWRGKNSSLYQQLMLLLSAADMVGSFALIFHPFSLPRRTREEGLLWASGNDATCSVSGFFFVSCFPLVSVFHMYLCGYFLTKVRYNTLDTVLIRRYAWNGVALTIFLCLSLAFMGSASQSYAPRVYHNICYFGDCEVGMTEEECREALGSGVSWYLGWVHLAFIVLPSLAALVMTIGVLATVRAKLIQGQRYDASANNQRLSTYQQDKLRAARTQALLYSLSYWNSFFWYFAYGSVGRDDLLMQEEQGEPFYFTISLLSCLLFPIYGLVNYAVYIRPRYLHHRKAGMSWCTALIEAVSFEPVSIMQHLKPATRPTQAPKSQNNLRNSMASFLGGLSEEIRDPTSTTMQEDFSQPNNGKGKEGWGVR